MISRTWQLQDAKNRFSEVVTRALNEGAQTVTKHGKPAVIVVSVEDYERTIAPRKSLIAALRECPSDLSGLIAARSKEPARSIHFD